MSLHEELSDERYSRFADLTGRVVAVMGGTSGLGRAIALGLARAGADVAVTGRREALVAEVANEIEALGRRTLRVACDVRQRASIDAFRDALLAEFGAVHVLVNAAGVMARQVAAEAPEQEWQSILDINVNGAMRACQSFYEPLKVCGSGRIINIASLTSFVAFNRVIAYGVSKSAVLGMTRQLAVEWAPDGISVNGIAPGVFVTDLNRHMLEGTDRGRELRTRTPMRRFGLAKELIPVAILFASEAATFVTGQTIAVDGGFLASGVNNYT
ncbi:MAG: SDR family oxidoreductase [Bryobacteraceae bacterium]